MCHKILNNLQPNLNSRQTQCAEIRWMSINWSLIEAWWRSRTMTKNMKVNPPQNDFSKKKIGPLEWLIQGLELITIKMLNENELRRTIHTSHPRNVSELKQEWVKILAGRCAALIQRCWEGSLIIFLKHCEDSISSDCVLSAWAHCVCLLWWESNHILRQINAEN